MTLCRFGNGLGGLLIREHTKISPLDGVPLRRRDLGSYKEEEGYVPLQIVWPLSMDCPKRRREETLL
jgi:hypothetical protein